MKLYDYGNTQHFTERHYIQALSAILKGEDYKAFVELEINIPLWSTYMSKMCTCTPTIAILLEPFGLKIILFQNSAPLRKGCNTWTLLFCKTVNNLFPRIMTQACVH